ncbi:hypothetical protein [Bradyrhizobium sp. ISRA464]|uniref:hypothetical protein n=1 Tax=Bradyrhizobium sp. ISRA464 TaxID=2866200 RepID=UPI00247A9554|nr:hypothetical protein [Bradyrhizobium sp. ISRA464]WGS25616.1 hypothetical protein MTX19_27875 [Bradyrhizobium sp. ISRA464]
MPTSLSAATKKSAKQCDLTAGTKRRLGIKFANRWFVGLLELLDDLEQARIDRRRGPEVRAHAEERAKKYQNWAQPIELLPVPESAASDSSEAPPDAA